MRKAVWAAGLRGWRKNLKGVPGTPDIAFTRYKLAVFVDGDFWHGRDFEARKGRLAAGNKVGYWATKIAANMERDARQMAELERLGWVTLRFWGSDVTKDAAGCAAIAAEKLGMLKGDIFMPDIRKELSQDDRSFLAGVEDAVVMQDHVPKPEAAADTFQVRRARLFGKKPEPLPDGVSYGKTSY